MRQTEPTFTTENSSERGLNISATLNTLGPNLLTEFRLEFEWGTYDTIEQLKLFTRSHSVNSVRCGRNLVIVVAFLCPTAGGR